MIDPSVHGGQRFSVSAVAKGKQLAFIHRINGQIFRVCQQVMGWHDLQSPSPTPHPPPPTPHPPPDSPISISLSSACNMAAAVTNGRGQVARKQSMVRKAAAWQTICRCFQAPDPPCGPLERDSRSTRCPCLRSSFCTWVMSTSLLSRMTQNDKEKATASARAPSKASTKCCASSRKNPRLETNLRTPARQTSQVAASQGISKMVVRLLS